MSENTLGAAAEVAGGWPRGAQLGLRLGGSARVGGALVGDGVVHIASLDSVVFGGWVTGCSQSVAAHGIGADEGGDVVGGGVVVG